MKRFDISVGAKRTVWIVLASVLTLPACMAGGESEIGTERFETIGEGEAIYLGGTEPFWSIEIVGDRLIYATPENSQGTEATVSRFTGNNGLGFNGELDGQPLQIAVTSGQCSDGMSDRNYPFTATVKLGDITILGCGYSDSNRYTGEE